jgi:hypothetical protein
VTPNGQNVVVAASVGFASSTDSGKTFPVGGNIPFSWPNLGDPSVTVGASGSFYLAYIGLPNGSAAALGQIGCATEVSTSPNGASFTFTGHAAFCPLNGVILPRSIFGQCFPDQEHIAADPVNQVGGKDQVYSVFRSVAFATGPGGACFPSSGGVPDPALVCSADGAVTWTPPIYAGSGDFARVTVGSDGFVYVVYRDGDDIMVNKFRLVWDGARAAARVSGRHRRCR